MNVINLDNSLIITMQYLLIDYSFYINPKTELPKLYTISSLVRTPLAIRQSSKLL